MVQEEVVRRVPYTVCRQVTERVENKVPVQVCRMVCEEVVRKVPVTTCRIAYEERIEQQPVQVCRQVAVAGTVRIPRTHRNEGAGDLHVPRAAHDRVQGADRPLRQRPGAGP